MMASLPPTPARPFPSPYPPNPLLLIGKEAFKRKKEKKERKM